MKLRMISKSIFAFALSVLFAASASATVIVQAATGHPHLSSGTATWSSEWTNTIWQITDGRTIFPGSGPGGVNYTWDTPIPIDNTNVTWNVVAYAGTGASLAFTNRICTFTSAGAFSACGSTVGPGSVSSATVPTNGSAYSQSFWTNCGLEFCGTGAPFYHIRAY